MASVSASIVRAKSENSILSTLAALLFPTMASAPSTLYAEDFAEISRGISQLITDLTIPFPHEYWMDLYSRVFRVCSNTSHPRPQELYEDIVLLLTQHCQGCLRELQQHQGADVLGAYLGHCERFFKGVGYVAAITQYLDRWWIKKHMGIGNIDAVTTGIYPIELLARVLWYDKLYCPLQEVIFRSIMANVAYIRDGRAQGDGLADAEVVTHHISQLRNVVASFCQMDEQLDRLPCSDEWAGERPPHAVRRRLRTAYKSFEEVFLRHSVEYYTRKGRELAERCSCTDFMLAVEQQMQLEKMEVLQWLPVAMNGCVAKCCECCQIAFVYAHRDFLYSSIPRLLRDDLRDDLRRLYRLVKPAHGLPALQEAMARHVEECGVELLRSVEAGRGGQGLATMKASREYAEAIWRLYEQAQRLVLESCEGDPGCSQAVDCALRTVVNSADRSAEALARFIHSVLSLEKKGERLQKPYKAYNIEQLRMASDLVKYIDDKDTFMNFAGRLLAKRLIQGSSASLEGEQAMIDLLQPCCGFDCTSRLQRMCADTRTASELGQKFRQWRSAELAKPAVPELHAALLRNPRSRAQLSLSGISLEVAPASDPDAGTGIGSESQQCSDSSTAKTVDETVDFHIVCLTAGAWPISSSAPICALPPVLEQWRCSFECFYLHCFNGRKLQWLHHLAKAEVVYRPDRSGKRESGDVELIGSSDQAAMLILFSDTRSLPLDQAATLLGLNYSAARRLAGSLVNSGLLRIEEPTQQCPGGVLCLDDSFGDKQTRSRVKLAVSGPHGSAAESAGQILPSRARSGSSVIAGVAASVHDERKMVIQASIVRLMKVRKRIVHQDMVQLITVQLERRFVPELSDIKHNIDRLIEKEYIVRDDDDMDVYVYCP